jgi:hypothetical protein
MDQRLQQLSYSGLLTLHECPRKFQLQKLTSKSAQDSEVDFSSSVTFAFGHAVGLGIQELLIHSSVDRAIWEMFIHWPCDLFDENAKQRKNFFLAIVAIQRFAHLLSIDFFEGYQLAIFNNRPAVELGFRITFPDGFRYRGFVDAVLHNPATGAVKVLEIKTTAAANLHPATYQNSAQGIGYSIVLDSLFPDLSDYEVLYLPYKTKDMEYEAMPFRKSYLQRALWIRELLLDIETIKMFEEHSVFPMRGESCFQYSRECQFLNLCTLSTAALAEPPPAEPKVEQFDVELTIEQLMQTQLEKLG